VLCEPVVERVVVVDQFSDLDGSAFVQVRRRGTCGASHWGRCRVPLSMCSAGVVGFQHPWVNLRRADAVAVERVSVGECLCGV